METRGGETLGPIFARVVAGGAGGGGGGATRAVPHQVVRRTGSRLHLRAEGFQPIAHEQGLLKKSVEIEGPMQALEAADEGGGMADDNDDLAIEAAGKPG